MPMCCEGCLTPFCPECGRSMAGSPLVELLSHVRRTERSHGKASEHYRQIDRIGAADKQSDVMRKWKRWGDALEEIMRGGTDAD